MSNTTHSPIPYHGNEKFFDSMLEYLNYFAGNPEEEITYTRGYPNYPRRVMDFIHLISRNDLTCISDYTSRNFNDDLENIDNIGWDGLSTIFTRFHRGERFCDGFIASIIKNKSIYKALKRVEQLINEVK